MKKLIKFHKEKTMNYRNFTMLTTLVFCTSLSTAHSSDRATISTHTNVPVTIYSDSQETVSYLSELTTTEFALVEPVKQALKYFEKMQGYNAYNEHCTVYLGEGLIKTNCVSSNSVNTIDVAQYDMRGIYAVCNGSEWACSHSFVDACQQASGVSRPLKESGYSCSLSEAGMARAIDTREFDLTKNTDSQQACSATGNNAIDDYATTAPGDNDETADVTTSCMGVGDCNDLIPSCIANGGSFDPNTYDPETGAPATGTCTTKSDDC